MKPILTDFKTERNDILPPLPGALRIIPIGFYVGLLGLVGIAGYSFYETRNLNEETNLKRQQEQGELARIRDLQVKESGLAKEKKDALEVQSWISSNSEVYPLVRKIAQSVADDTTISELTLTRLEDNASHIKMKTTLYSAHGGDQIESLVQSISDSLSLRNYGPTMLPSEKDQNDITYECNWAPMTNLAAGADDTKN
jgi:hypothetical protein